MKYLEQYANETASEFEALADCIWKFNLHIDDLREEEIEKLKAYFPNDPKFQALRWRHESHLLEQIFPKALNYSFVVFVYIEIETRLMRLCNLLHENLSLPIMAKDLRGQGVERYIEYLNKFLDVSKGDLLLIEVIKNLGKVRNCIVHTNGFLEESKDNKEMNRIIDNELYLMEKDRSNPKRESRFITVEDVRGEPRLRIDMHYPFSLCGYARDFFLELVALLDKKMLNCCSTRTR